MKTKQFDKKLGLKKKTIANLNNRELKAVDGGAKTCATVGQVQSCITFNDYTCCTTNATINPPLHCLSC